MNPIERQGGPERPSPQETLRPNQPIYYLDDQYTVHRGFYCGRIQQDDRFAAVISPNASTDPERLCREYELKLHIAAGHALAFEIGAPVEIPPHGEVEKAVDVPYETCAALNPHRSKLQRIVGKELEEARALPQIARNPGEAVVMHTYINPPDIPVVENIVREMERGHLPLKGYGLLEKVIMGRVDSIFQRAEIEPPERGGKKGYLAALGGLQKFDAEIAHRQQIMKKKLNSIQRVIEEKQRAPKQAQSFETELELEAQRGSRRGLEEGNTKRKQQFDEARQRILEAIGFLLVASEWYHESNPRQRSS